MELESAASSDPGATSAVKKAKDALLRGRKLLAEHQKLIKIADCSDLGWAVVSKYSADELADDKRLEKAEKMAERKANRHKKNAENRHQPYRRPANPCLEALPGQSVPYPAVSPRPSSSDGSADDAIAEGDRAVFCLWPEGASQKSLPKAEPKSWYPQKCCEM